MSSKTWMQSLMWTSIAAVAVAGRAHADAESDHRQLMWTAANGLANFVRGIDEVAEYGTNAGSGYLARDPKVCRDHLTKMKAEGVKGSDRVQDPLFGHFPGVAGGAVLEADDYNYSMAFSDGAKICERFAQLRAIVPAVAPLVEFTTPLHRRETTTMDDVGAEFAADLLLDGAKCEQAVDQAQATGVDRTVAINTPGGAAVRLDTFAATYCQPMLDWGNEWKDSLPAYKQAQYEALIAPYVKVGIKGDRLELFLEKVGSFLLPGCTEFADESPKKLAKAKALFFWLTDDWGYITVRKYKFKGNTYKITEQVFDRAADAYKACK